MHGFSLVACGGDPDKTYDLEHATWESKPIKILLSTVLAHNMLACCMAGTEDSTFCSAVGRMRDSTDRAKAED